MKIFRLSRPSVQIIKISSIFKSEIKAEDVGKENVLPGNFLSLLFSYRHDLSPAMKET